MHNPLTITCLFDCDASFVGALPHIESKSAGGVDADVRALWSSVETVFRFGSEQCARASVRLTFTCYSVLLFVLFGKVFFDHGEIGECFLNLQNRCSCKCCRFSLEGARFNCLCYELRACMCAQVFPWEMLAVIGRMVYVVVILFGIIMQRMIPAAFFFSVRVEGCVSVRRISVGQGRGRWGAATELSDSFSILSLWLQPPRWSQVVHVRLCLKGQVSDSILWNI